MKLSVLSKAALAIIGVFTLASCGGNRTEDQTDTSYTDTTVNTFDFSQVEQTEEETTPMNPIEKMLTENGSTTYHATVPAPSSDPEDEISEPDEDISLTFRGDPKEVYFTLVLQDNVTFKGEYTIDSDNKVKIFTNYDYIGRNGVVEGQFEDDGRTLVLKNCSSYKSVVKLRRE